MSVKTNTLYVIVTSCVGACSHEDCLIAEHEAMTRDEAAQWALNWVDLEVDIELFGDDPEAPIATFDGFEWAEVSA